jgi:hypothetical protein
MLDRPPSLSNAARARASRARRRDGIRCYRVTANVKRLVAAMRRANPKLPERELTDTEIREELTALVQLFVSRWLGPVSRK